LNSFCLCEVAVGTFKISFLQCPALSNCMSRDCMSRNSAAFDLRNASRSLSAQSGLLCPKRSARFSKRRGGRSVCPLAWQALRSSVDMPSARQSALTVFA
jgi:hypothetical protein